MMWLRKLVLCVPLVLSLAACNEIAVRNEQCDASIRAYNRMLRWQEYEPAEKAVVQAVQEEFRRRLSEKDLHIADYRIRSLSCNGEKGEAEVLVEYDYYLSPSTKLKTVEDVQKWRFSPDATPGGWRVVTPPPEFR